MSKTIADVASKSTESSRFGKGRWRRMMERKEGKGVRVAGGFTKLPSIRGLSFASRRPVEAGLADIASVPFHRVSFASLPNLGTPFRTVFHLATVEMLARVAWRQGTKAMW